MKMRAFILLFIWFIRNPSIMAINEDSTQDISTHYNYCKVEDLRIFSSLSERVRKLKVDEDSSLKIQFCKPLAEPCNGKDGYSICFNKNGTEVGIGSEPPQVEHSHHKVLFRFTGDTCNATHNYTLNLEMYCNPFLLGVLKSVENWTDNCHFDLPMLTSAACPKRDDHLQLNDDKCQITSLDDDMLDLSGLNEQDFYTANAIKGNKLNHTFRLSLCGGKKVCNDSHICDEKMSYGRNVTVISDYRSNMIGFHFTNGSKCADGSNAQSTLYIRCNESAVVGELTVLSDEYCNPELVWSTADACSPPLPDVPLCEMRCSCSLVADEDNNAAFMSSLKESIEDFLDEFRYKYIYYED